MSLSAREQQALDSIEDGLAGSDPQLTAWLSTFTRLASDEEMPDREKIRTCSAQARARLRRAQWRSRVRSAVSQEFQRAALLLWLATSAALLAVALALTAGHHACAGTGATACAHPAPQHSLGSTSPGTATDQAPAQQAVPVTQAGP
jgi:Protein of unknown function (DUF3040)